MKTKIVPMMEKIVLLLALVALPVGLALGQTTPLSGQINIYTPIVSLDRCGNIVTVATSIGFAPGNLVLLIQLKGGVIDSTNTPAFGTILDYDHVGNFEFATIETINGNQITFREDLLRGYNDNK